MQNAIRNGPALQQPSSSKALKHHAKIPRLVGRVSDGNDPRLIPIIIGWSCGGPQATAKAGLYCHDFIVANRRPATIECSLGHLLLEGDVTVNGETIGLGDHALIPPDESSISSTESGCLSLVIVRTDHEWIGLNNETQAPAHVLRTNE